MGACMTKLVGVCLHMIRQCAGIVINISTVLYVNTVRHTYILLHNYIFILFMFPIVVFVMCMKCGVGMVQITGELPKAYAKLFTKTIPPIFVYTTIVYICRYVYYAI